MEKEKIGIAVIGLGVGEQHARALSIDPRCQMLWLCDLDANKAKQLSQKLNVPKTTTKYEEILKDPDVQAVILASYDDIHFEQVVAALQAGKHIFVEKPLCRTTEELKTIQQLWAQHNGKKKLSSNLILRATPLYQWARNKIQAGELGEIYAFDGDYLYGRLHKITQGWRKNVKDYSVILGGGIHLIDLMLWLTGQRPTKITAFGNRISTQHTDYQYNDFVSANMHFPSGMVARITSNYGCIHRHHHIMRIFGTQATFLYDDAGPRFHTSRDPALHAIPIDLPTLPAHKGDLLPGFISAIINDEDWQTHTQELFDDISICAACDIAARTQQPVEVQYV